MDDDVTPGPDRPHGVLRPVVALLIGVGAAVALSWFVPWPVAVLAGWDAAAAVLVAFAVPELAGADGWRTARLAGGAGAVSDVARRGLLIAAGVSLAAAAYALRSGTDETGATRVLLIAIGALTVILSWTLANTVFALRYAELHHRSRADGIDFGTSPGGEPPSYADFAYLSFTLGMTYQVSDTVIRDPRIRRTALVHSLFSYVFGVVIVASGVSVIAGLAG